MATRKPRYEPVLKVVDRRPTDSALGGVDPASLPDVRDIYISDGEGQCVLYRCETPVDTVAAFWQWWQRNGHKAVYDPGAADVTKRLPSGIPGV